jgi:ribokinase
MKYDFITVGGATEDITFYTKEGAIINNKEDLLRQRLIAFEYGAKIKIDRAYSTFGGGAANAAVCLSKLGLKTAAMVSIGADLRGESLIQNFKDNNVSVEFIQKRQGIETGFSLLLVGQSNEHVVFSNRADNKKLAVGAKETRELDLSDWIYLTSLSGQWRDVLKGVFKSSAKIAWNPGHIQLHAGFKSIGKYLSKTTVLSVNKDEAIELVVTNPKYKDKPLKFLNNIKNLLELLHGYGVKIVLITNGRFGASAYDGRNFYEQPIIKERRRMDTTGVGDAFGSTFAAGLKMFNGDIAKSMLMAAKNTASVIGEQGAQNGLLTKRGVMMIFKKK